MEILIWGDNMKRQMSISIFLAILVILLAWLYIKFSNEIQPKNETITTENNVLKEPSVTINQTYITYPYYIKDVDGRLVVFLTKTKEVYMETGIENILLPNDVKEKLETGIFFENEEKLYDFLESYSS